MAGCLRDKDIATIEEQQIERDARIQKRKTTKEATRRIVGSQRTEERMPLVNENAGYEEV